MMKRIGIGILVFGFVLFMGTAAQAVPYLGVGGALESTSPTSACATGEYWNCFAGSSASGSGESFWLPTSPGGITVWADEDRVGDRGIWLVAEESIGNITFTGASSETFSYDGKLSGYQGTPYDALYLGPVGTGLWQEFDVGEFGTGTFWIWQGTLTYDGPNPSGDWLFAVASSDSYFHNPGDKISPKTTSMIPEPGTLLLLGSGLVGLGLYRRKFKL